MPVPPERVDAAEGQIVEQSKRIDFFLTEYSVELLASKTSNGDFEIPPYQREDTWEPERKSRFIESLLMGLPIPFLFFWERPETGKLEIVDGSQRPRTITQFVLGDLTLGELDTLTELEGMRFRDLPPSRQRKIENRSVRGIVLNEHADEQARFEIFDRINTSSKIANKAEVRRGALIGPFLDPVISLTDDETFVRLAPIPEKAVEPREREELVTRFFAYLIGIGGILCVAGVLLVGGCLFGANVDSDPDGPLTLLSEVLLGIGGLLFIAYLITMIALAATQIGVAEITDDTILLKNVHDDFSRAYREQSRPGIAPELDAVIRDQWGRPAGRRPPGRDEPPDDKYERG